MTLRGENGFWLNNYMGFERKRNRNNRLILNFLFCSPKESKKVKVFVKSDITIPSKFISFKEEGGLEKVLKEVEEKGVEKTNLVLYLADNLKDRREGLEKEGVTVEQGLKNYSVFGLETENNPMLIDKLKKSIFQKGNYERVLRLGGFYPERKVIIHPMLEKAFTMLQYFNGEEEKMRSINCLIKGVDGRHSFFYNPESKNYEIELFSGKGVIKGINFSNEFLRKGDYDNLAHLFIDIEKPLWKRENEKELLDERENLLKRMKREKDKQEIKEIKKEVKRLEKMLEYDIEGVGRIKLYDERYDARVSWLASIWKMPDGDVVKELDTLIETGLNEIRGFTINKYDSEKDLINAFVERVKSRPGGICSGHNEVYDIIQLREAAKKTRSMNFDIAVQGVLPKRDYVRKFCQRMDQDFIYLDTLWLTRMKYPFIKSKMPAGSHRLEDVCNYLGYPFKKEITHEQLREIEIKAMDSKSETERIENAKRIAGYVVNDVEAVFWIMKHQNFIEFLSSLKECNPAATTTENAFATSSIRLLDEQKYFNRCHNQKDYGYQKKVQNDRTEIFKKRYASIKSKWLQGTGLNNIHINGMHKDVQQIYFSLEKFLLPLLSIKNPEYKQLYSAADNENKFLALQYIKAGMRDMLTDYYFCMREKRQYDNGIIQLLPKAKSIEEGKNLLENKFERFGRLADSKGLWDYYNTFNWLKNVYRSIYVALEGNERAMIRRRETKGDKHQLTWDFVSILEQDNDDIFLLRQNSEEVRKKIEEGKHNLLNSFMRRFDIFDEYSARLEEVADKLGKMKISSRDFVYLYNQKKRAEYEGNKFYYNHKAPVHVLDVKIRAAYSELASEINGKGLQVVKTRGDYLFVKPITEESSLDFSNSRVIIPIRRIDEFIVRDNYKEQVEEGWLL